MNTNNAATQRHVAPEDGFKKYLESFGLRVELCYDQDYRWHEIYWERLQLQIQKGVNKEIFIQALVDLYQLLKYSDVNIGENFNPEFLFGSWYADPKGLSRKKLYEFASIFPEFKQKADEIDRQGLL